MTTTSTNSSNPNRTTVGSICKVVAAAAIVGMITVYSVAQMSRVAFAPAVPVDVSSQSDLRDLLCRVDHRCPAATRAFAHLTAR